MARHFVKVSAFSVAPYRSIRGLARGINLLRRPLAQPLSRSTASAKAPVSAASLTAVRKSPA
jgi:hypothetical protein